MTKILKTVQLTSKEWDALLTFMEYLSDHQANAGCNDLPKDLESLFTKEEGKELAEEFAKYNNPTTPEGPDWPIYDSCLLDLLKHKIQTQI